MRKIKRTAAFTTLLTALLCNHAHANENLIYISGGASKDSASATTSGKSPLAFGYLRTPSGTDNLFGVDIGQEGTLLDSTWGQTNAVNQATSYNFLIGKKLGASGNSRFDGTLILGIREKTSKCPASYIGYQCYANSQPDTTYGFNYGATLFWTYQKATFGLRVTGESTQAIIGIKF